MSTWFADVLPVAPLVVISSPVAAEAGRLLRLLHCLCRRALILADVSAGELRNLPLGLQPTLLMDMTKLSVRMQALLRASGRRGFQVVTSHKLADLCCAKAVFCSDDQVDLAASESAVRIHVPLSPTRSALLDDRTARAIADEFQPQLLQYRLEAVWKVKASTFDAPEFVQPARDVVRSLGAAIVNDVKLQMSVIPLLKHKDEELRAYVEALPERAILEVLLACLHEGKSKYALVKEIAEGTNVLLRSRGEILEYRPEEIGHRLTALGLPRRKLGGGKGVLLCRAISRQVHWLAKRYGVAAAAGTALCPDCQSSERVGKK